MIPPVSISGGDRRRRGIAAVGTLDFSGRPKRRPVGWGLLVVGLALAGWQAVASWEERQTAQAEAEGLLQLQASRQASAARPMTAQDQQRHQQVEWLAAELAAPWDELLRVFETHAGRHITLLKFEPDAHSGQLRVTAEAGRLSQVLAYVAALEQESLLQQVMLTQHQPRREAEPATAVVDGGAGWTAGPTSPGAGVAGLRRIEFNVTAHWRPVAGPSPQGRGTR